MLKRFYFILLFLPIFVGAQNYPAKPSNYVTDETGTLTQEQQNTLNAKLKVFEDTTTNQIFVYMSASLNGQDMTQLCQDIFHEWHIGQKGKNNGVLIAIFKDDHKFRIHTGYGLEGRLPDLLTKRIQDEDMRPCFKEGNYYLGILAGVDKLIYYSGHEFTAETSSPDIFVWQGWLIAYVANVILLIIYLIKLRKKRRGEPVLRMAFTFLAIIIALFPCIGAIILFFMLVIGSKIKGFGSDGSYSSYDSSSSWSSSSDSSWSSSDSSSDFGGGGGGDSGGGGSSSDW